jgi:hypothetical protein
MTGGAGLRRLRPLTPAKAGVNARAGWRRTNKLWSGVERWIPAFAGMSGEGDLPSAPP